MRKFIFVTFIAIALTSILFFAIRDEAVVLEELSGTQNLQNTATQYNAPQSDHQPPEDSNSDAQIFDDGIFAINWYEPEHTKFVFPNGTPLENYKYYELFAEWGNGLAAYQLANMMSSCGHTYLSQEELDEAIVQMRQTSTRYDPKLESTVRIAEPELVEEFISRSVAHFENCKDFTTEQRDESDMWMELAANNGHTTAMLDYGRQLSDPLLSVELYRSAWEQGDADALGSLAEGLEQVYDKGIDPTAKVPAYVAMHAYVTLLRKAYGSDEERVAGRWTLRNQAKLDEMGRELMPHELEAAVEQSRKLIAENKNCCYSM